MRACKKNKQRGSTMVEYTIGVIMLTGVMFMPVSNGKNTVELMYDAFKENYSGYAWAMSIPT